MWLALRRKTCQHCKLENYDNDTYMKFCTPSVIDKTLNTLEGILTGITIDKRLNELEISELKSWCNSHAILAQKQPYNELFIVPIFFRYFSKRKPLQICFLCAYFQINIHLTNTSPCFILDSKQYAFFSLYNNVSYIDIIIHKITNKIKFDQISNHHLFIFSPLLQTSHYLDALRSIRQYYF